MRTTIGFGGKRLLASYASNYWFVHKTTIGLRENDSCCILCPLSLPSTLSGKMLYIPSRYQGRSEGLITVSLAPCICFLLRMKLFPTYWDEEAHLSLLSPMYRKLGASYHYYKRPITPLLYSWLTVVKSVCALGPFLNQYCSILRPVLVTYIDQYWSAQ